MSNSLKSYTYLLLISNRAISVDEGLGELTEVIRELGSVISEERVKQAISALGLVSRENTRSGVEILRTSAVPPSRKSGGLTPGRKSGCLTPSRKSEGLTPSRKSEAVEQGE
jgi:hypothetical protein